MLSNPSAHPMVVACRLALLLASAVSATSEPVSFNTQIQPLLAEYCYACHGTDPSSRKADLRLDKPEFAYAPHGDMGPAIIPGKPDESPLIKRIEAADPTVRMPPPEAHKTLRPDEIALLRQWIREGAKYQAHWAFIAPQRPTPPKVKPAKKSQVRNPIDAFVLAQLASVGLDPEPEADRGALIRRVTLDLTGLLPTTAEIDAFLADRSRDAYERLVDRLLTSPRWGEHRARYWLDYVRYADTHGIHFDNFRAIWPYRDYVVRAYNENKPFDRFVREQLAGDLLPARTFDELAATGYIRNNMTTNEGGAITEEVIVNLNRDRVEAFGATFLGLTTGCAACHDHKFDPITQRDHFSLTAFLGNTREKAWDQNIATPEPVLRLPNSHTAPGAEFLLKAGAELQLKLANRRARALELTGAWLAAGNRPERVSPECLELHLPFNEGQGDTVKNLAWETSAKEFTADTNPLIWGENTWLWPSMRMDIFTRLSLGDHGDFEAFDSFSAGGWILLRAKPGAGVHTGTGSGSLLSRMHDQKGKGGTGWEIYQEGGKFTVSLRGDSRAAANSTAENSGDETDEAREPKKETPGIGVITKNAYPRDEWLHVFFTYDGSRKAGGLKIYVNGKPVATETKLDTLRPGDSIRTNARMHLGRRDDGAPMRETRYQDLRVYRRALSAKEVARLPFEEVAAGIVSRVPDPARWTTDEAFVVAHKFFLGQVDKEAIELAAAVDAHEKAFEAITNDGTPVLIAKEKASPAYADILKRGDYYARIQRVEPAVPQFLPPLPKGSSPDRLGLADWLFLPDHPLMARVTVNRMWQEIFGRGLVETAGDFGIMGDRPSHPQLLDWLAVEFRESGWDTKKLYRTLVTSATYRQSATVTADKLARDPANRLLTRGPRFRMDGEMLRDSALQASGLLVEKMGGPPVKPYQPRGIWEEVAMPESNTRVYVQDKGEGLYRRSLYTFWKRSSMPPSMETFDATSRELVCTRRARSNTPLQAFVTMNDPQWVEAARKLAERALHSAGSDTARLEFLSQTTLARPLHPREIATLERSLGQFRAGFSVSPDEVQALLKVGDAPADPSLNPAEIAPWTLVASQFLNLDEFLTK